MSGFPALGQALGSQLTELGGRNVQESVTVMLCSRLSRVTSLAAPLFLLPSCCFFCFFDGSWSMGAGFTKGISSWRPGGEEPTESPTISQEPEPTDPCGECPTRPMPLNTRAPMMVPRLLPFPSESQRHLNRTAGLSRLLSQLCPAVPRTRRQAEFGGLCVNKKTGSVRKGAPIQKCEDREEEEDGLGWVSPGGINSFNFSGTRMPFSVW